MQHEIKHLEESNQFVVVIDDLSSILSYTKSADGKILNYRHTFVPPELRGRHIASELTRFALDYARRSDYKVIATCPFVRKYIEDHPEYNDIVATNPSL